ncbi:MAG: hypothetical protein GY838_07295, partial [bacterium]|nr:hypothetical protein [bacterium]
PTVIDTVPSLDEPVDPTTSIRFDFNEAIVAGDEALDGDGVGDAAELYGESAEDGWVPLPVVLYLTRSGYSLQVEPRTDVTIRSDTLNRRIVISPETGRLQDSHGNVMEAWEKSYRLFDDHAPKVDAVPFPDGAAGGDLIQGVAYTLVPVLTDVDDVTPENPGGDVDRVEYFFADPEDPSNPQVPSYSAVSHPFSYAFIGAYSGDGTEPRPFPVWVKAVDTSTNESNVMAVAMQVLPNAPPVLDAVSAEALGPVPGTFYAGSAIRAVVSGLDDLDGAQLTLSVELWQTGTSSPLADYPGRQVLRPDNGWADLEPQTFDFEIPIDLAEGTPL